MIRLETLPGDKGTQEKRKRIGRGDSSGHGGTSTKGHKGAKARKGTHQNAQIEGGQTPITRRMPKRGFDRSRFQIDTAILNLSQLEKTFEDGATVDFEALVKADLVPGKTPRVKILGMGEIKKKLNVTVDAFSASAKEKIEAAGGQCKERMPLPANA
ncbi:TPA: 50S ribosomal protein L15 [Candidatus Sumerlaeota bacterium]|jgi:large subunit ribosomal protein L15|nr:50S ribosomal protein L15 [Candidatus Sumerlaeota bacterium]